MQLVDISKWFARYLSFAGWSHDTTNEKKNAPAIILTLPDGRKLVAEDLRGHSGMMTVHQGKLVEVTGNIRYEIIGTDNVPTAAESLHQRAREAGRHGDYK